jgi:phosphatidylserine/phosphatidylglycerophosphate/cardiolipin synthase-like enzyme
LTAARANVLGDLNLATCAELLRRTGSPANLRIVLHPRMVHGKAMVGDGEWVDLGSTNFTTLSHASYEELDLFLRDAHFAAQVEQAIENDIRAGAVARLPLRYRRLHAAFERVAMAIHGRH